MKKLIILSLSFLSISCSSNSTPECADEVVKRTAIEILNENIKEVLTKEYVSKNYMTIRNLYLLLYCLIFEPESKSTCYEFA